MNIDMDFVREQFPALAGDWVFMDNAGGSQTLQTVVNRIAEFLLTSDVQLGAGYQVSQLATQRVDDARKAVATLVNAAEDSEIIIGTSTTQLLRNLSLSLGQTLAPGDEIVVTNCDHEANIGPWRNLEKQGMVIKEWRLHPDTLHLHLEDLEALMTAKTRLVALTHASNILGTLNPVEEIAAFVHRKGALVCADGVAYAPHRLVDVRALDVDFYAFSFYKVYGPHQAVLYAKKEHLEKLPGINHFFIGQKDFPAKMQPGGVNYESSYGLLGVCDYFRRFAVVHGEAGETGLKEAADLTYRYFAAHESLLSARLLEFLNSKSRVRVIGKTVPDPEVRVPTISFMVEDTRSSDITLAVDKHLIGIRFGHFYAKRLIDDLGLAPRDGVVRVSMVHYNTLEEVDRLIGVLDLLI